MTPSANSAILAKPLRLGSLFLHFFDIHFIEEKGSTSLTKAFKNEIHAATRIAVAVSERVFIPAASYFESPICQSIVNDLYELFELGNIVITGSSPNLDIFINEHRESAFYQSDSLQHRAYALAKPDYEQPAYISRTRSATRDIVKHWNSLVFNDILPERLFRHQKILPEIERRLKQVLLN